MNTEYQDFFNKIYESITPKNMQVNQSSPKEKFNSIITKIDQLNKNNNTAMAEIQKIFNSTVWKPQFQQTLKSLTKDNKIGATITRIKHLHSVSNKWDEVLQLTRMNTIANKNIDKDNLTQFLFELFEKLKFYQDAIKLIGDHSTSDNIDKFTNLIKTRISLPQVQRKQFEFIIELKNCLKLADEALQPYSQNKNYANKKQVILAQRIFGPMHKIIKDYKYIQAILTNLKGYELAQIKKVVEAKVFQKQTNTKVEQIIKEQQDIVQSVSTMKQKINKILIQAGIPFYQSQNKGINRSICELSKNLSIVAELVNKYNKYAESVMNLESINPSIDKLSKTFKKNEKQKLFAKLDESLIILNSSFIVPKTKTPQTQINSDKIKLSPTKQQSFDQNKFRIQNNLLKKKLGQIYQIIFGIDNSYNIQQVDLEKIYNKYENRFEQLIKTIRNYKSNQKQIKYQINNSAQSHNQKNQISYIQMQQKYQLASLEQMRLTKLIKSIQDKINQVIDILDFKYKSNSSKQQQATIRKLNCIIDKFYQIRQSLQKQIRQLKANLDQLHADYNKLYYEKQQLMQNYNNNGQKVKLCQNANSDNYQTSKFQLQSSNQLQLLNQLLSILKNIALLHPQETIIQLQGKIKQNNIQLSNQYVEPWLQTVKYCLHREENIVYSLNQQISNLDHQIKKYMDNYNSISGILAQKQKQIQSHNNLLENNEEDKNKIKLQIDKLNQQKMVMKNSYQISQNAHKMEINQLLSRVDELNHKISQDINTINIKDSQIAQYKQQIQRYQITIQNLKQQITALENNSSHQYIQSDRKHKQNEQKLQLTHKVMELQNQLLSKQDELVNKDKQIQILIDQSSKLQQKHTSIQEQNIKLKSQITKLKQQITKLKQQMAKPRQQIAKLRQQVNLLKKNLKNMQVELQTAQSQVTNKTYELEDVNMQLDMFKQKEEQESQQKNDLLKNISQLNIKLQQKNKQNKQYKNQLQKIKQSQIQIRNIREVQNDLQKLKIENQQLKKLKQQMQKSKRNFRNSKVDHKSQQQIRQSVRKETQIQLQNKLKRHGQIIIQQYKQNNKSVILGQNNEINIGFLMIQRLFQGQLLNNQPQYKTRLVNYIEKLTYDTIKETKLIYKLDLKNTTNFHQYLDNKFNLLCVLKTKGENPVYLAGYYTGKYQEGDMIDPGFILNLTNDDCYYLNTNENINKTAKIRCMIYDRYYLIFGNAQLRIRSGEKSLFSNFGITNSFFNNRGKKLADFIGISGTHDVQMQSYEIYSIKFETQQRFKS